ncbi:MAG: hypothetical protein AABY87_00235 [bacterium]
MIRRLEWTVGAMMVIFAITLHVVFLLNAGGFWRDEVSRIQLATLPSLSSVWSSLKYDVYPLLSPLVIRLWAGTGWGGTDLGLRVLGLFTGIAILGSLWFNARQFSRSLPLLSMSLFALSPLTIRTGDAVGQYGLGIFLNLLVFGLIWDVVESPSLWRSLAALPAAVLSMQCVYQSVLLIFAFCMGGIAVTIYNARWKRAALLAGIGIISALSLFPYMGIIKRSADWGVLVQYPNTLNLTWEILERILGYPIRAVFWIWVGLFLLAVFVAGHRILRRNTEVTDQRERDAALFLGTVMVTCTVEFFIFFRVMKIFPNSWYFLYPMAIVAVSLDAILGSRKSWGLWRAALALLILVSTYIPVWNTVRMRQTNMDLIAAKLKDVATPDDIILVNPWYLGVTFQRYYKGRAPWMTIPPMEDLKIHRYDLLKKKMASPDPLQPVLSRIAMTLQAGNRLWLVGSFSLPENGQPPGLLEPAPHEKYGWDFRPYLLNWETRTTYFIESHARDHGFFWKSSNETPVNPNENARLDMVHGWRSGY